LTLDQSCMASLSIDSQISVFFKEKDCAFWYLIIAGSWYTL
jgi:hypothetical protein